MANKSAGSSCLRRYGNEKNAIPGYDGRTKMGKKAIFLEIYASDCIFIKNLFTLVKRKSSAIPKQ